MRRSHGGCDSAVERATYVRGLLTYASNTRGPRPFRQRRRGKDTIAWMQASACD